MFPYAGTIQGNNIPTTVHTANNSPPGTTNTPGSAMDTADMKHILNEPNTNDEIKRRFLKYNKDKAFKKMKFPMSEEDSFQVCEQAVTSTAVQLPDGVTTKK